MIHLNSITKQHGQRVLFKDASLQIRPGDRIGLVGPNGAGKTTVFRIIMREEGVEGEVNIAGERVGRPISEPAPTTEPYVRISRIRLFKESLITT